MSDSPHITALRKQDKLNRLAVEKFRVVNGRVEKYKASLPVQDIEEVITAKKLANQKAGDFIPGKGIFFGKFALKDKQGNLKMTFNMYAAPENLVAKDGNKSFSYSDTLSCLAGLEDWHGHQGTPYATDAALFEALEKGSYNGGWFVPTNEMLLRMDNNGNTIAEDNLYGSRGSGEFKNTFETAADKETAFYDAYWGSSQLTIPARNNWTGRFFVRFDFGRGAYIEGENNRFFCRPVRLEPAP